MFLAILLVLELAMAQAAPALEELKYQQDFSSFVKKYNKQYEVSEIFDRFATFKKNMKMISEHDPEKHGYSLKPNQFLDQGWEEFASTKEGYVRGDANAAEDKRRELWDENTMDIDDDDMMDVDDLDWRKLGAVTPVKNQGSCRSCYTFSSAGALEAAIFQSTGRLFELSTQELLDCSGDYGNYGCGGGTMLNTYRFIKENGVTFDAAYPYTGVAGQCTPPAVEHATLIDYREVRPNDEESLKRAVTKQPVSAAIDSSGGMQFYAGGVYTGECGTNIDHAVLIVGYGTDQGQDYWLIKNSWGSGWGEDGYIRLARHKNMCGIELAASYPIVAQGA